MTESGQLGLGPRPANPGGTRDVWLLLVPAVALYLGGLASIIWLETPQRWWAAGTLFAGGVVLQAVFMRRQGRATQLALFAVGLVFLILYLIGAVTDVRWLMFLGFAGFLSIFAIRMLLWVDRKTPNPRRWSLYLRAFSFPVMAIGGLSETEWLLWTGAAGFGLSVVVPIGFDIAWAIQAIRTRRKVKR